VIRRLQNFVIRAVVMTATVALLCPSLPSQQDYTFRTETDIVLVNVTARDRDGKLVKDLKSEDFTVLEDNKAQKVSSFDTENTDAMPATQIEQTKLLDLKPAAPQNRTSNADYFKDRRAIILFFDLSAMQPDEIERAVTAANNYVDKQMAPADVVAVVSLGSSLTVNQDFTSDKDSLRKALDHLNVGAGEGFESGSTGTTEGTSDTGQAFTVDDTEYNIFNTDRRLEALRAIASRLASVNQKKSLIYFSSGMERTGIENQSQLRAATNAAVRANLSIYTMDIRGLQALVPGGEAQQASLRGTAPYSGRSTQNQLNSNFSSQETLVTLAGDTGGRAFLDSNDFGRVFRGVQEDTASYYVLGYHSTNTARDGRFRRITVKVNRPGVKLEFRRGYYAPADFRHTAREDRERQLEEELDSELPTTDLPVYLSTAYFRVAENRFYVPVSVVVPGSEIPFLRSQDQDKATLDVIGVVTDEGKRPVSQIRDTVKLTIPTATEVRRKNVQYNAGLTLISGNFHLKLVVRENETGRMGSFETDLTVPAFTNRTLKMSSVVLASQMRPEKRKSGNPLVRDGSELIPSVTHVFSSGQQLYLYYEVYDPGRAESGNSENGNKPGIRVLSSVAFFKGNVKAYETSLLEAKDVSVPGRHAASFQLDVPLSKLQPGFYTCQVNVIDDAAGRFAFPRLALLVREQASPSNGQ
jgi:VWFA-related protein